MATHSSILAWRIPWTEEAGRLLSMVSKHLGFPRGVSGKNLPANTGGTRVRKIAWKRKWQPIPVFLPIENPVDRGTWCAIVHGVKEIGTTD